MMRSDGGPAFPMPMTMMTSEHIANEPEPGMTLRDYFAAQAMQGLLANDRFNGTTDALAKDAYKIAHFMLAERAK